MPVSGGGEQPPGLSPAELLGFPFSVSCCFGLQFIPVLLGCVFSIKTATNLAKC